MSTTIELTVAEQVARVSFQSANGIQILSSAVRARLAEVLTELERRSDVHVVLFQAQGRTFIAGADIHELKALNQETAVTVAREGQRLMQRIAELPMATVVAIHAACAGGGCELALACDHRLAADAARIGLPETSLGLLPGWGGTVRACRSLGSAVARRMIFTGELLPAAEALRLGLVDAVFPADEFRAGVDRWVGTLLSRGPTAIRLTKQLLRRFEGGDMESELAAEALAFAACYATPEPQEGTNAFLEKRPARFRQQTSKEPS